MLVSVLVLVWVLLFCVSLNLVIVWVCVWFCFAGVVIVCGLVFVLCVLAVLRLCRCAVFASVVVLLLVVFVRSFCCGR